MSLVEIVTAAVAARLPEDRDGATVELALTYARLLDDAAPAAKYAAALRWMAKSDAVPASHKRTITAALSAHTVASDLGPKLLAALDALQMTPRARAAAQKASTGSDQPSANPLDQLAQRRAGRRHPPTVDAATP